MGLDDQKREKIGIAKVSNVGTVDIYYVGGSTFELVMPNNKTKPLKFPKAKLDEYIGRGAVLLSSQRRYNEICAAIHSDGSTDTHNADGTPKTETRKIFEELESEGFIPSDDAVASYAAAPPESPSNNTAVVPNVFDNSDGGDDNHDAEPTDIPPTPGNVDPFNLRNAPPQQDNGNPPDNVPSSPFEGFDGTPDSLHTEPEVAPEPPSDPRDVNGDGVVDEFDDLQAEMRAKSPLLVAATTVVLIITCVAFFGFYILIHGIIGGNEISFDFDGDDEVQIVETVDTSNEEEAVDETGSTSNLTNRTDFDPEDAVADYPLASDDEETIVIGLFQALRAAVNSGEVTTYNSLIAIDNIAETIAGAYASYAQTVQGLTDVQTEELRLAYAEQFALSEREHVVDKDLYATFVGGRLREVRVDPNNSSTLYAVMESIAGDHQRICFVVTGSNDSYAITGVMDPDGYVRMIASGDTSDNVE